MGGAACWWRWRQATSWLAGWARGRVPRAHHTTKMSACRTRRSSIGNLVFRGCSNRESKNRASILSTKCCQNKGLVDIRRHFRYGPDIDRIHAQRGSHISNSPPDEEFFMPKSPAAFSNQRPTRAEQIAQFSWGLSIVLLARALAYQSNSSNGSSRSETARPPK